MGFDGKDCAASEPPRLVVFCHVRGRLRALALPGGNIGNSSRAQRNQITLTLYPEVHNTP
jgi:hypothetical protein